MKELLLGLFLSRKDANNAQLHLTQVGVKNEDIFVIAREDRVAMLRTVRKHITGEGAITGGILGGLAGVLVASIPVILPGMGIVLVGWVVIFIGFAIGAVIGGILGVLVDLGISIGQLRKYKKYIRLGGALIVVSITEEKREEVQEILDNCRADEQIIIPYKLQNEKADVQPLQVDETKQKTSLEGGE